MGAREKGSKGILGRISSGMTSVAGITAAVATITTSAAAVLGVVVHHQAAQLQHAHAQVSQQAQQITALQSRPTPTPSAAPSAAGSASGAELSSVAHYLSNLNATVDDADLNTGQVVIGAKPYVNSISFDCQGADGDQPDEAYDVAGSSTFTAEVGIADDMTGATDVIATVTFTDESGQQIGKPVQVSLGHPVQVSLNISGVTQLGMTCNGRDQRSSQVANGFQVALGSAGVS